jgi:5-methylcytosine-specific restriction endonuclease McrA
MASSGNNPRITKREWGLIKGSLRRVFARSELRNAVVNATILEGYTDPERPRVKTWCYCKECEKPEARSYMVVDHVLPIIKIGESFEGMSIDEFVNRLWCDVANLSAICITCHKVKCKREAGERATSKRAKKKLDNR